MIVSASPKTSKDPVTELKSAAQLYWIYSFFLGFPLTIVVVLSHQEPNATGFAFLLFFAVLIMLLVLAGGLLFKRKKLGLYLGWLLMPFILIAFPIGTALGFFIISKLVKTEVKALLK